jgi:pimeloyl-ACP methyl ester carboxylesterase
LLYTYRSGEEKNPAILFLHGGGLGSKSWLPVIERLPEFYCLAPDLPEQGRSTDVPYSISGSAEEVAGIIQTLAPGKKAHLVALSLGGPVALTLLRTHPDLVDHVLLSGSSGHFPRGFTGVGKATIWMYRLYKPETLIRMTLRQHGIPEEYRNLVSEDLKLGMSPAFMRHYMSELGTWELPTRVERPLLLVVGEKEPRAARSIARGYLKRYPSARGVLAPDAKHAWPLQFPDRFAGLVRAWVTDQPLPPEFKGGI